ncbi:MAG: metal-dependent hydrolase [Acidobacteria bacterium]|nr:metal-dependent hydrolase [Acidobacteriota bacterium]
MDVLTHTVVAVTIGMAGYGRWGRRGVVGLVAAANLPELERAVSLGSTAAGVKVIYGATHSLVTAPVWGLLLWMLLARWLRDRKAAAILAALGLGSHLAFDLVSGPGVRLFWPIASQFYGWRLVARYDLLTLGWLGLMLVGPRLLNLVSRDMGAHPYSPQPAARVGLAGVVLLVAARVAAMGLLEGRATGTLVPSALSPLTWYAVADAGNAYTIDEITPWGYGVSLRYRKPQPNRAFETAADTPLGQAFLELAQFPQYSLERGDRGMLVRIRDLRFYSPAGEGKECSVEIEVTPQLQVVSQRARM